MAWFRKSSWRQLTRLLIEALIQRVTQLEKRMSQIDDLKTKVEAQDTVIQSAITLLSGLKDRLAGVATGDAQKVQALMQDLDTNTQALAQAVAANTTASETTASPPQQPAGTASEANPQTSSGGGTAG